MEERADYGRLRRHYYVTANDKLTGLAGERINMIKLTEALDAIEKVRKLEARQVPSAVPGYNVAVIKAIILHDEDGKREPVIGFVPFEAAHIDEEIEWRFKKNKEKL